MEEAKTDQRQGKKEERSFELRSEKVRSIVGQIPSVLVRYGITAIGVVLICLLQSPTSCPISKFTRERLPYMK